MKTPAPQTAEASAVEPRRNSNPPDLFPDTLPSCSLPIFPEAGSVKESALLALVTGPVRQSGFDRSWRLAAYVRFLKDDGWSITSRDVSENGRIVSEYQLDRQDEPTREAAARYRQAAKGVE